MKSSRSLPFRIFRFVAIVAGSILGLVASVFLAIFIGCEPPSLTTLAKRFPSQRAGLEELLRMSDQDLQLDVIDPQWMEMRSPVESQDAKASSAVPMAREYMNYSPETGISLQRYNEYMRLFREMELGQGLRRYGDSGDAFFIVQSVGLLERGYSNGFLYCGHRDKKPSLYEPCNSSKPFEKHNSKDGGEGFEFRRVADNWFVFTQGPG